MSIIKVKTGGITADAITDALIADDVVGTEHLTANEVDTTALGADAVTAAQIADDAISEEHLDVTAITGHTAETSIADGDTLLIHDASASALRKMTKANFVSGIGGDNTPAFSATLSSAQNVSNNATTTIVFNSEHFDTDSAYSTSNGRFTVPSGEGGKYLFSVSLRFDNATSNRNAVDIQINGSADGQNVAFENTGGQYLNLSGSVIMNLSAGDYVSVLYYQTSGGTISVRADSQFSGFKLIGV